MRRHAWIVLALVIGCGPSVEVTGPETDATQGSSDGTGGTTDAATSGPSSSAGSAGDTTGAPDSGETSTSGDDDDGSSSSSSGTVEVPPDCDAACESLDVDGGCYDTSSCQSDCALDLPGQSDAAFDAFSECAETNPLCFETMDQCVLRTLYPRAAPYPVTVSGVGFAGFEGASVRIASSVQIGPALSATVRDAGFVAVGSMEFEAAWAPFVQLYVDVDDDGACSDADLGFGGQLLRVGSFDEPAYALEVTAQELHDSPPCGAFE